MKIIKWYRERTRRINFICNAEQEKVRKYQKKKVRKKLSKASIARKMRKYF